MDKSKILDKIRNKDYESKLQYPIEKKVKDGYIFDEDKSVKWNREEVERKNIEVDKTIKAYKKLSSMGAEDFQTDVVEYLVNSFDIKDNKQIAEKIFSKAYEDGHSNGYYEVFSQATDIGSFVEDILRL